MPTLTEILTNNIEPTEPVDTILAYWRENEGRNYTKRDMTKLQELCNDPTIRMSREAGMTKIKWGKGNCGNTWNGRISIGYHSEGRAISTEFLLKHNPEYYSERVTRNGARRSVLNNPKLLALAEGLIAQYNAVKAQLAVVEGQISKLTEDGGLLQADRYKIERDMMGKWTSAS